MPDRLPDHTIRPSTRAKTARLTISPRDGLVVVIPKGFDRRRIPALLRNKQRWIDRHLQAVERHRTLRKATAALPDRIILPAVDREWSVTYRPTTSAAVAVRETASDALSLTGATDDDALTREALRRWLRRKVHHHLVPQLRALADKTGLPFGRPRAAMQRTLWASCSGRNTISLNLKLLFLPSDLVRYVLVHELCHTACPNHSPRFWALVRSHQPDLADLRQHLKTAWRHVPTWVDP
ncbi:MAG: M48 family metallopeptidase [Planctomycetota bacterium]